MFSYVLVSYMSELRQFAQKTNNTFQAILKVLEQKPKYDFCILKELTHYEGRHEIVNGNDIASLDKDHSLFFAEDYVDRKESKLCGNGTKKSTTKIDTLIELCKSSKNIMDLYDQNENNSIGKVKMESGIVRENSAEMLSKILKSNVLISSEQTPLLTIHSYTEIKSKSLENKSLLGPSQIDENEKIKPNKNLKTNAWIELFADLDPLENLEAFDLKLSGNNKNYQQT